MRPTKRMLNWPRQQVAPLGGVLRADITTRLFANRLTARWRLLTIERSGASSSRLLALWPPSTAKFRLSALAEYLRCRRVGRHRPRPIQAVEQTSHAAHH